MTRSKISRIIAGQRSPINNPDPPLGATLSPQHSINTTSFHSKSPENFDKIIPRVPFLLWFRPPPPCGPVLFNRGCWSVFQVYLNICSPVRGPVVQALELETILREVSQCLEKALKRAFSWLKMPTSTFTFKTLHTITHYAKWVLSTVRSRFEI